MFSSTAVALGLLVLSYGGGFSKYSAYLVGDILSVSPVEILWLFITLIAVIIIWAFIYNKLLIISINRELAASRGVKTTLYENIFVIVVAVVVMLSIKWVGILLINSLLILPSAAARNIANLVLQDNNFSSMPQIVNEGRRVINNIKESAALYIMKTLLTALLALSCILVKTQYFFKPSNMMLYEMFVSAVPSLALSLQPNTERVKGKFIPYVVSRALPGALTMGLCIFSVFVISQIPDLATHFGFINPESEETIKIAKLTYDAIMMLVLTCTGLVMLFRICQPFNVWRTVLYVASLGLCILAVSVPFFAEFIFEGWSKVIFNLPQYLLLIIIIQAALPISGGLIKFFDMFNPAD